MDGIATTGADLAAAVPADMFSGIDAGSGDPGAAAETPIETPSEDLAAPGAVEVDTGAPAVEEPVEEPVEPPVEEPAEETPGDEKPPAETAKEAQPEELPEGVVRGKDRNGKDGLFVTPKRWETIYASHKTIQQFSEAIGEPVTPEALDVRNRAYLGQERLYSDLLSGEPEAQASVLNHWFDEMASAREAGEIGADPAVPLATSFYQTLQQRSPDGYAQLRLAAAKDLLTEMFSEAARNGDESLFLSAQNFTRAIASLGKDVTDPAQVRSVAQRMGLPFYTRAEMQGLAKGEDRLATLERENQSLKSQLTGRSTTNQAAQFDTWFGGQRQATQKALMDEAIMPSLAETQKAWEKFPTHFQNLVVKPLHSAVAETLRADKNFSARIDRLHSQAKRAVSAQVRESIGREIQQAYVNRARLAVEAHKGKILADAAALFKGQNDARHNRLEAGKDKRAPGGPGNATPKSIAPQNLLASSAGKTFDPAEQERLLRRLVG